MKKTTTELKETFQEIEKLKAELQKLQPLKAEDEQRLWKKFRLEWNYNSNHMEGNTLTYGHTKLLLFFDQVAGNYTGREVEEMKAHDVAIKMVEDLTKDKERDLTENFIRQLNEIILVRSFWKEAETPDRKPTRKEITPGEYKKFPNNVRLANGEIFHFASVEETPALMNDLMQFYKENSDAKKMHPVELAALMHYKFVRIHPFDDGNGRVARLIMNYVLLKNNLPPVVIKDADKKNYILSLNKADTDDIDAFVLYVTEQLKWSFDISIKAANGESIEEPDDLDKEISILTRELDGEDILKEKATPKLIFDIVEENLFPLFKHIEEKLSKLKGYFFDYKREILYRIGSGGNLVLSKDNQSWDEIQNIWSTKKIGYLSTKLSDLKYTFSLIGFKKSQSAFTFDVEINIFFNNYNYIIERRIDRNVRVELPYNKVLSNEELRVISDPLIKKIIEDIKSTKV